MFPFFFPFVLREVDREGHAHFSRGGGGGEDPWPQHLNVFFFFSYATTLYFIFAYKGKITKIVEN